MTQGVDIIGALLRDAEPIVAAVPIASIKAGSLPENAELSAILVRCISSVERDKLKRGAWTRTIDRIAVTVRTASYREQRTLIKLITTACAGKTGDIGGGVRVSILSAGIGPDVRGPGNSFEQTHDFRVSYDAN
jgi:hypothetical protein